MMSVRVEVRVEVTSEADEHLYVQGQSFDVKLTDDGRGGGRYCYRRSELSL